MEEPINFQPEYMPKMLVGQIDIKFEELKGKKDRLSLEWGHFSRGMNLQIREYLKVLPESSLLREQYNYTMIYWTCKSKLLDLYMRHRLIGQGRIRREKKLADKIKNMILNYNILRPVSENDIISATLGI